MLKSEAVALVSALDEKRFDSIENIAFEMKPTKFAKGFEVAVLVIFMIPVAMLGIALVADGVTAVSEMVSKKLKEREAKKAAEIQAKFDKGSEQRSHGTPEAN